MCGITALISKDQNIFPELYESLYHLQHRGQDSFGFSFFDQKNIKILKKQGLVSNFTNLQNFETNIGMGHVRYPTNGNNTINESQPFYLKGKFHTISMIHNGQVDVDQLKQYVSVKDENASDTIYLLHYLSKLIDEYVILNDNNLVQIVDTIQKVNGSFNCICLIEGFGLLCFKDKYSTRPLILGRKENNYILSSESISITSIDYEIIKDIYGYEILVFDQKFNNLKYLKTSEKSILKPCIFEWIYLAREESTMYNVNVYQSRVKMGEYLAEKIKKNIDIDDIDLVVPVPDTSKPVALSISKILKKPYYEAITKNRYVNRTFIMDSQNKRKKNIKRKLNVIQHLIQNKNILIVDDSIVRGNTIKHIINLLKDNYVNKIFVAICSPEIINTNHYGIDIPTKKELLCFQKNNKEIENDLGIEKIIFQNINDLKQSIRQFHPIQDFELSIFSNNL
tara:strand:- start:3071 stop:4426 length:1356 start_codon:yes stop_codon:yes gene_type:complete